MSGSFRPLSGPTAARFYDEISPWFHKLAAFWIQFWPKTWRSRQYLRYFVYWLVRVLESECTSYLQISKDFGFMWRFTNGLLVTVIYTDPTDIREIQNSYIHVLQQSQKLATFRSLAPTLRDKVEGARGGQGDREKGEHVSISRVEIFLKMSPTQPTTGEEMMLNIFSLKF